MAGAHFGDAVKQLKIAGGLVRQAMWEGQTQSWSKEKLWDWQWCPVLISNWDWQTSLPQKLQMKWVSSQEVA